MSENQKISVIIPVYNTEKYLAQAIQSVLKQEEKPLEIIVVDDGSTDGSVNVATKFGSQISLYQHQTNKGVGAARNLGVNNSKGEFLAFLDADDQWTPGRIEKQIDVMMHNSAIALVAGDMAEIDLQDRVMVPTVLGKHSMLEFFQDRPHQVALGRKGMSSAIQS